MAVYIYCRKIKRGLIITTASEVTILGIVALVLTYNYTLEQLIMMVIVQTVAFGIVIYDAVILLRKKEGIVTLK